MEKGFPGGSEVQVSACNVGDLGSFPGSGRCPGEGNGNPLQYSCLKNPMDGWKKNIKNWLQKQVKSKVRNVLFKRQFSSVQFSRSAVSNSLEPQDCNTPDLPVHHQLPEFTQTHVHWVSDAIQSSYPLLCSSPPTFNFSQHQGLF